MIHSLNLSKYEPKNYLDDVGNEEWVGYGDDNLFPQYLISLYRNSAVHGALVNSIAQMIFGKGLEGDLEAERLGLNDQLRRACLDLKLQGGFFLEIHWNVDRTGYKKILHTPFERVRCGKMDDKGQINEFYYCLDWEDGDVTKQLIPAWNPEKKKEQPVQLFYCKPFSVGDKYYPKPDYFGAINWIEADKQIAVHQNSNLKNGMMPSFAVHWKNGIPAKPERDEIRRDMENELTGAENSGRFIMTFSDGADEAPSIEVIESNDSNEKLISLSDKATDEIMIGHRVTSPSLFGVKTAGQLGGTDELKTASLIFDRNVIKPYRRILNECVSMLLAQVNKKAKIIGEEIALSEEFSLDDETQWLDYLKNVGEEVDLEEWELVSEEDVNDPNEEYKHHFNKVELFKRFANPDDKSEIDTGLYKIRYRYSQNLSDHSRTFCKNMVANSKNGVVYRFEDIQSMEGVNKEFAPKGKSKYSIWLYKGGAYCHHKFVRQIYFRKRSKGKFLPNDGLDNDKIVSGTPDIPLKDKPKGYDEANTAPIDTPNRGSLKNG